MLLAATKTLIISIQNLFHKVVTKNTLTKMLKTLDLSNVYQNKQ